VATASRGCHFPGEDLQLFSLEQGQAVHSRLRSAPLHDVNLVFSAATLGDLANHSADQPELLNPAKLQCARTRLKKGDVAYLAQAEGRLASLVWIGKRNELTGVEAGLDCHIPFEKLGAVIYDLWVAPGLRKQITPSVLRTLVSHIHDQGLDAWIFCKRKDISLRKWIHDAGFSLRCRLRRARLPSSNQLQTEREVFGENQRPARNIRSDVGFIQS
jgi:hypothetical protein